MRIARMASTSVYGERRRESRYDERDEGSEAWMTMNGEAASATRVDEVLDLVGQRAGGTERDVLERFVARYFRQVDPEDPAPLEEAWRRACP